MFRLTTSILFIDRIPSRSASNRPNAIVCKFTRGLAKGKVMATRRRLENLEASQLGFPDDFDISHINLYDHITPRRQELLFESKKYKNANNSNSVGRKTRGTQRQVSENICSEDDLRSKIFGTFVVRFLASCLSQDFRTSTKWFNYPFLTDFYPKKGHLEFSGAFS